LIAHGDEDRVFTCERADDLRQRRIVDLDGYRRSPTRKTLGHDEHLAGHVETH
jgi:hypothetical protein